jgi:hypothetical protein
MYDGIPPQEIFLTAIFQGFMLSINNEWNDSGLSEPFEITSESADKSLTLK